MAPGVSRHLTVYAWDDLAVDCLLGAEALYAEPSAYNLVTSNPWWQLGKDKFEVVTVANSEAAVHSVFLLRGNS